MACEVRESPELGRYYVAARPVAAGEQVLLATPTALALSDAFLSSHCSACSVPTTEAACETCGRVRLCPACAEQEGAWGPAALHERECDAIRTLFDSGEFQVEESRTVRLLIRLLVLRTIEKSAEGEEEDEEGGYQALVDSLCDNQDQMPEALLRTFADMVRQARRLLPAEYRVGLDEGVQLLAKVYCNAHEVLNPSGADRDMGFGIFPEACLFNHSCEPNCTWFPADGGGLAVRTISAVEQGAALTVAYCDLHDYTALRRPALERAFFFQCACPRCVAGQDQPDKALCARKKPLSKDADADVTTEVGKAGELLNAGDAEGARVLLDRASARAKATLADTHTLSLRLRRARLRLAMIQKDWKSVLEESAALSRGLSDAFGAERVGSDLRYAFALFHGARALAELGKTAEAVKQMRQALRVYATVLGSAHWHVRAVNAEVKGLTERAAAPL